MANLSRQQCWQHSCMNIPDAGWGDHLGVLCQQDPTKKCICWVDCVSLFYIPKENNLAYFLKQTNSAPPPPSLNLLPVP